MFQTTCKKCIFSIRENNEQTGCSVGRLDKFSAQGITSYEADGTGGFYSINGRKCNMCHQQDWVDHIRKKGLSGSLPEKAREEATIKFAVSIFCDDNSTQQLDDSVRSVINQPITPKIFSVINLKDTRGTVLFLGDNCKSKWKVVKSGIEDNKQKLFNESFKNTKCHYYVLMNAGSTIPTDLLSSIDERINDDLEKMFYHYDEDNDILIVQSILYWMLPENSVVPHSYEPTINDIKEVLEDLKCTTQSV